MTRARRDAGFTLVEIMVAVAILAVSTALVYGSLHQTLQTKEKLERIEARYHGVRLAMNRLVRELSMAYLSKHDVPGAIEPRTFFLGDRGAGGDRLSFTAMAHVRLYRDADESDTSVVSYFVDTDREDNRRKHLFRRESRRVGDEDARDKGQAFIACEDVDEFRLEYFDPVKDDWQDEWDTKNADGQPDRLPPRVRIELTVKDEKGQSLKFVTEARVFLTDALILTI